MAGVTKHPETQYWTAIYYDGIGGKFRRSTKQTNRGEALRVAQQWEDLAKAGARGRITEIQARKVVGEILQRATGETLNFFTCKGWFAEWLAGKKGVVSDRSYKKYDQVCDEFLTHIDKRAELPLAAIGPRDVRGFRDKLAGDGLSPATVNQSIRKVLTAPFAAAIKAGLLTHNPCATVEPLRDAAGITRDAFTAEQVGKLLDASEGDWTGAILMGFNTSLRLGDVVNMQWQSIDLAAGVIKVHQSKTGAPVTIPIHPDLSQWLSEQPAGIGKAPVFPSLAGKDSRGRSGLSSQFRAIMEKAGVAGRALRSGSGKGRTTSSLSYHSLRHAFVSILANEGVSAEVRQKLSGHADARSHAKYTHLESEVLRAAVAKLPNLRRQA